MNLTDGNFEGFEGEIIENSLNFKKFEQKIHFYKINKQKSTHAPSWIAIEL